MAVPAGSLWKGEGGAECTFPPPRSPAVGGSQLLWDQRASVALAQEGWSYWPPPQRHFGGKHAGGLSGLCAPTHPQESPPQRATSSKGLHLSGPK